MSTIIEGTDPVGTWTRTIDSPYLVHLNQNGDANGDGRPAVVHSRNTGRTAVAWASNNGSDFDVVVSVFDNGSWSTPVIVAGGSFDQRDPQLAIDPATGDLHVVFWEDGTTERVFHASGDPTGQAWSTPTVVSEPGDVAVRPSIAYHQGQQTIAYESHNFGIEGLPKLIVVATNVGGSYSYEMLVGTQRSGSCAIEVHSSNTTIWVEWIDAEGQIGWQRRSGSGSWESTQFESYSDAVDLEYHVRRRIQSTATQ
ncbi:MAG: hypothetical protein OEV00_00755 [Acidobacteriota bacterium]|nr:hypothetical protein [Acidobacteriota bacterium]MDH3783834.1 hypothetical protein [Acidobacteriota bacterium]